MFPDIIIIFFFLAYFITSFRVHQQYMYSAKKYSGLSASQQQKSSMANTHINPATIKFHLNTTGQQTKWMSYLLLGNILRLCLITGVHSNAYNSVFLTQTCV